MFTRTSRFHSVGFGLIALCAIALFAASADAASFTAADGNWTTPSTWTVSGVDADGIPDADDTVNIPTPRVVTVTGAQGVHIINVNGGATLTLNAGSTLTLDGTAGSFFTNGGTVSGTGTVRTQGSTGMSVSIGGFSAPLEIIGGTTNIFSSTFVGSITVISGAVLQVDPNDTVTANGNLTVTGTLTGGNGASSFNANGPAIVNNGSIAITTLRFQGTSQALSGTGSINSNTTMFTGSTVTLGSNIAFASANLTVNGGGSLAVGANTLTLNGVGFTNNGTVTSSGAGVIRMQGASAVAISTGFTAALEINSGTTNIFSGTIAGPITVLTGAVLSVDPNDTVTHNGNLTVGGTLTGGNGASSFNANGPVIVNNGTISVATLRFNGAAQSLSGTGSIATTTTTILNGSTVTLLSNVAVSSVNLTIDGGGALAVATNTLTLNGVGFTNNGTVTSSGAGLIRMQGVSALAVSAGFTAPIEINSGTTTIFGGTYAGSITVLTGAVFTVDPNDTVTHNGNLTVGGTLSGGSSTTFIANGGSVVNNGLITLPNLRFNGTAQSLSGTGSITSTTTTIFSGSTVTLLNDITVASPSFTINGGGALDVGGNTLTLNGVSFTNNGTVTSTGSGLIRTQGVTSLTVSAGFTGSLEVNSGTTNIFSSTIAGSINILSGAILSVDPNDTVTHNGALTVNGTLTGGNAAASFNANGAAIVNNGTISVATLRFQGTAQSLSGTGSFTSSTMTIFTGSTVTLPGSITVAATNFTVNGGGSLAIGANMLTLNGVGFTNSGTVTSTGAGLIRFQGVSALAVAVGFSVPLEINSGTTRIFGTTIASSINVLSGTILLIDANDTVTHTGNLTVTGTLSSENSSGGFNADGAVIVNNGSITAANLRFNAATSLSGTGSITSAPTAIMSGSTVTLGSDHQLATLSVSTGGAINTATFTLSLNGAGTPLSGAGTIANVNVTYNGIAAQTVQSTNVTYNRLGIDNAAGVTLSAAETVSQRLLLMNGAFNNGANLTLAVGATIERNNGTLQTAPTLLGNINLVYSGSVDVITGIEFPTSPTVVNDLLISKATSVNTVTLDANRTVNGALTLTMGNLVTGGAFNIIIGASGTASGNVNGFVIGNVQKTVAGPGSTVYPVGTATGYAPATINIDSGTGTFTVTTANGVIGGLAPAKALNRYWSLTPSGITKADITFQYQQADVPGPANESGFDFFRNGGGFFDPSVLDTTNNVATLNNVTQFSDWTLYDPTANAPTTVLNTNDSGPGSLRQLISDANALAGADTLVFDGSFGSPQTISLASGEIEVTDELTITGPGAKLLTISGNTSSRIFSIATGETASFSGFTMTAGNGTGTTGAGSGGAIYNLGNLSLTNVAVAENSATSDGGGIYSLGGTLDISGSTVSGNSATINGGGIYIDATIATIHNSTISGNTATVDGGGINVVSGTLTITFSTIADNDADGNGGGVNGPSTVGNTIVANNTALGTGPDYSGSLTSQGYNLIEDTTGATIGGDLTGNITGQDPVLGALANNLGPTFTHALLPGSPAIDTADPVTFPATDQRGASRPRDGDSSGGARADIGAFEKMVITAADATITGRVVAQNGRAISGAVIRLQNAKGESVSARSNTFGYFRFKSVAAGETYVLTVSARGYRFSPTVLSVEDNVSGLILTPTGRR